MTGEFSAISRQALSNPLPRFAHKGRGSFDLSIPTRRPKREFTKEITEAANKAYGLPKKTIVVLIKENSPENVSVGGELIVDKLPQG